MRGGPYHIDTRQLTDETTSVILRCGCRPGWSIVEEWDNDVPLEEINAAIEKHEESHG